MLRQIIVTNTAEMHIKKTHNKPYESSSFANLSADKY